MPVCWLVDVFRGILRWVLRCSRNHMVLVCNRINGFFFSLAMQIDGEQGYKVEEIKQTIIFFCIYTRTVFMQIVVS